MKYEVTLGKAAHQVEVKEIGGSTYEVRVDDGDPIRVDAMKSPNTTYSILVGARQFEGSVDERADGTFDIHVGASAFDVSVIDERKKLLLGATSTKLSGKQELTAQMPGKIVKVLVRPGDSVEEDAPVVVIEAMKMENELRSPIAGTVTRVEVSEGNTVETGALLAVVEPPASES
jgi:biotin carboxyl carrier protein